MPEAIEDAKRNAELNGIENAEFEVGEAETVIPKWYKEGITADTLVVDPPRKGCDEALLRTIIEMKPKRVVYVSCNPGTLARDLRVLEDGGYATLEVQPVDMFPHTSHVECVAKLVLKKKQGFYKRITCFSYSKLGDLSIFQDIFIQFSFHVEAK